MNCYCIVFFVFIFYNFDESCARSVEVRESKIEKWLSMKVEDVDEKCESSEKNVFDREAIDNYFYEVQEYTKNYEYNDLSLDDYFFNVTYNPNMLQTLKILIKTIQNCLDENDRLNPEELGKVINRVLTTHANRLLNIVPTIEKDLKNCGTFTKLEKCAKPYEHLLRDGRSFTNDNMTILQVLIPAYVTTSSCAEVYPLWQCFMKHMKSKCNSNVIKYIKVMLTPSEVNEGICENYNHDTDMNGNEKIIDIFHQENDDHDKNADDDDNNDSLKRLFYM